MKKATMPQIDRLSETKCLLHLEANRVLRGFVGTYDECVKVRDEWLAGDFSNGKAQAR